MFSNLYLISRSFNKLNKISFLLFTITMSIIQSFFDKENCYSLVLNDLLNEHSSIYSITIRLKKNLKN